MIVRAKIEDILGTLDPPPRETEKNRKGVMIYSHKTGGEIQVFSNEEWDRNKKYYKSSGGRSNMKNFTTYKS